MNANGIDLSSVIQGAAAKSQNNSQNNTQTEAPLNGTDQGQVVAVPSLAIDVSDATFEQVLGLSGAVPVIIYLWAQWSEPCKTLGPTLENVTESFNGKVVLAKVDVDSNPQIAEAFQAKSIPTVAAVVAGQAVPLFQGELAEAQVRDFFEKLITVASQNGVTGIAQAPGQQSDSNTQSEPEPQINPAHEVALDALESGDYKTAKAEYERVIKNNPKDDVAIAQFARASLLDRLDGVVSQTVRDDAAANRDDLEAQLLVADLDLSGGHIEDAFLRILDLFEIAHDDEKTMIRERLLELFEVVGQTDPRVTAARARLTNLLF